MTYSYTDLLALFGIGGAHPGGLTLTRALLDELKLESSTEFLEVGCGTGQTTAHISNHYPCQLYAIDQHPVMVEKAKKRLAIDEQSRIVEASAENLPFVNQKFDYVLSESVTAFTNINVSLSEYFRVLKDSGQLLLIEMTKLESMSTQESKELLNFYQFREILTEEEWKKRLIEVGFTDIQTFSISLDELLPEEDDFTEFDISPDLDPNLFDILDQHDQLTQHYQNKLGFRVFFCNKS
ncbi:SAM-dependent methyltransferase [Bacillus mesophilus]|uniref:Methyltransferase domain-containing protein n=1 Tax=Bacillus mesophilus TaxID=1808955 RepID=A0A6M0Q606_9BACI|nr:class I SAM-dependent methyltransferase [Bacillus mesophilus]MBM7659682.1 SAM-dependent methyltransferase [Bacillus mesophilus]NEY70548.1 methyltransferase domain-containing protein [Bacillus mesophilus]